MTYSAGWNSGHWSSFSCFSINLIRAWRIVFSVFWPIIKEDEINLLIRMKLRNSAISHQRIKASLINGLILRSIKFMVQCKNQLKCWGWQEQLRFSIAQLHFTLLGYRIIWRSGDSIFLIKIQNILRQVSFRINFSPHHLHWFNNY